MTLCRSIAMFCMSSKLILHMNAVGAHHPISLECLSNVGNSNEWDPGSEGPSEPRLSCKGATQVALCLRAGIHTCGRWEGWHVCVRVMMSGSERSIFRWQNICYVGGHYAKRSKYFEVKGGISLGNEAGRPSACAEHCITCLLRWGGQEMQVSEKSSVIVLTPKPEHTHNGWLLLAHFLKLDSML